MPIDFQPVSEGDSSTTTIDFQPEESPRVTIDFQPIDERPITPGALVTPEDSPKTLTDFAPMIQPSDEVTPSLRPAIPQQSIAPRMAEVGARPYTPLPTPEDSAKAQSAQMDATAAQANQLTERYRMALQLTEDPYKQEKLKQDYKKGMAGLGVTVLNQEASLMEPAIPLSKLSITPQEAEILFPGSKVAQALAAAQRAAVGAAEGITAPIGLIAPLTPRTAAAAFGAMAGAQVPRMLDTAIQSGKEAAATGKPEVMFDPLAQLGVNSLFAGGLIAESTKPTPKVAVDAAATKAEVSNAPATAEALRTTTQDLTGPPGATVTGSAEPTKGVETYATAQRPSGQITEGNLGEHPPGSEIGKTANSNSDATGGQDEAVNNELIGMGGAVPSEGSKPTITDLIPPRPGESPQSVPRPETPNKTLFQSLRDNFGSAGEKIKGFIETAAGKTFPKTTGLSREAGEMGARYISSSIAARPKAEIFSHDVLAGLDIDPVEFGAALSEDNLRSIRERYSAEAQNEKLTPEARAAAQDAANRVFSFVGDNGTFKTEQVYQDYLKRNEVQEAIKRHKDNWVNVIEPMFKEAMRIDPDTELPPRGLQTGARVNLAAIQEGEAVPKGAVWSSGKGNLLNTLQRKSPFGVRATGAGQAYLPNYIDLIENSFGKQLEIANKNVFDASLVKNGLAVIDKPGQHPTVGGEATTAFPIKRKTLITPQGNFSKNEMIYVRNSIAREYRTAANVDNPWMVGRVLDGINRAALAGLTDATVHLTNLSTSLAQLPVSKLNLLTDSLLSSAGRADLLVAAGRVLQKAAPSVLRSKLLKPILPERIVRSVEDAFWKNQSQLASLAEIGALKGRYPSTGPIGMRHMSELIQWYDKTVRAVLDDAYQDLAKRGIVENTETARREFVNQIGQYNTRAQGPIMQLARKSGIGPFATAGRTFNVMGVRGALLNPGVKATSPANALALRANAMSKWMGTLAFVGMANYLLTGKIAGRPGTGFGKIDTGKNDDQGRMLSFDVMGLTGQGRALRVTGARGAIDATMKGLPPKLAADASVRDIVNSWTSPIFGPPIRAGMVAASGFPAAINVGRVSRVVAPSESQAAENLKQALIDLNPVVSGISKSMEPGKDWQEAIKTQLPRFTLQAKQTERMMEQYPLIVRKAKARAFIDDVIHVARGIENPDDKIQYLRESLLKLDPADREHAMRTFKEAKVMAPR